MMLSDSSKGSAERDVVEVILLKMIMDMQCNASNADDSDEESQEDSAEDFESTVSDEELDESV
jgi:hypothetical protein